MSLEHGSQTDLLLWKRHHLTEYVVWKPHTRMKRDKVMRLNMQNDPVKTNTTLTRLFAFQEMNMRRVREPPGDEEQERADGSLLIPPLSLCHFSIAQ